MSKFVHGGDVYEYARKPLDFSANISPLGLPSGVKSALSASIGEWAGYPDPFCRNLTAAIAKRYEIEKEWICCGNGAADLLFKTVLSLKPRCALLVEPSFSEYRRALQLFGCEIKTCRLEEQNEFCLTEQFLNQIDSSVDLVILCNPNNPTGQTIRPELLSRILAVCAAQNIHVLLDECFVPFLDNADRHSRVVDLERYPNLLILRAFTKFYAMAGLRLGYLLCSDVLLLERIFDCGPPWSVSAPAQVAGTAALLDTEYGDSVKRVVKVQRAYLTHQLRRLGFSVIGSHANYLFFKSQRTNLREILLGQGILIRSCANYNGLDAHFYRVSVRTYAENQKLVSALANLSAE